MVQANPRFLGGLLLQIGAFAGLRSATAIQAAQSLLALDRNFSQKPFLIAVRTIVFAGIQLPRIGRVGKQAGLPD